MANDVLFEETELPDHSAWEFAHVGNGTAIWARHVDLDEFAARENIDDEERSAYRSTSAQPFYQIELSSLGEDGDEYGVVMKRSTGPDSVGVITPDGRKAIDGTAALTHVVKLQEQYA